MKIDEAGSTCEICGSGGLSTTLEEQKFEYGAGDEHVSLTARVPVFSCDVCGEQYTDERAEVARHNSVCAYLGRLTPGEIRSLRELYDLSQDHFAQLTGFGVASIKRWERGNLIQSVSADRYLRLLRAPNNFRLLAAMNQQLERPQPVFRTDISQRALAEAKVFKLRPEFDARQVA